MLIVNRCWGVVMYGSIGNNLTSGLKDISRCMCDSKPDFLHYGTCLHHRRSRAYQRAHHARPGRGAADGRPRLLDQHPGSQGVLAVGYFVWPNL